MPDIEALKKQLKGIKSTQKLTKAMKTISTVKFSKLKALHTDYFEYGKECSQMLEKYGKEYSVSIGSVNHDAPPAVVIMASNRGLCGKFNDEVLNFAINRIVEFENPYIIVCSKKGISFLKSKRIEIDKEFILDDVPPYTQTAALLDEIFQLRVSGEISDVYVIYQKYYNMVKQVPCVKSLFDSENSSDSGDLLYMPDKNTMISNTVQTIFKAMFYEIALESSMGAQGATLMTMRSAYDTATEYCENLESEINHIRQSAVTADVIETSGVF